MTTLLLLIIGIIIIILYNAPIARSQEQLDSVQILVRHGDRENDLSLTATGQLTDRGKREMYDFGLYLRRRYGNLLKTEFDSSEAAFISSAKDRSVNSASLIAYGLYKDYNLTPVWSGEASVRYEPVPVRAIPTEMDNYLQMTRTCPLTDYLYSNAADTWMEEFRAKHPELVATYEKETGTKSEGMVYGLLQEEVLYNVSHGLPLRAKWLEEFAKNRDFVGLKPRINEILIETEQSRRLYVGPMLELIIETFEKPSRKLITVYSGHDRFMYMLLVVLGVWDHQTLLLPPPGSAIFMEAISVVPAGDSSAQQDFYLKFWYRNDTSQEPRALGIPSCPGPCTLSMFKKSFQHLLSVNYDVECQLKSLKSEESNQL